MTGHASVSMKCAALFIVLVVAAGAAAQAPRDNRAAAAIEEGKRVAVMISGKFGPDETYGAGIVFAIAGDKALVFTANHIIRSSDIPPQRARELRVQFRDYPSETFGDVTVRYENSELDLAVLEVGGIDRLGANALTHLPFDLIKPGKIPKRGDAVFAVGNPNKWGWGSPIQPDLVDSLSGDYLYFQSSYVEPGHSGGPVLDASGHVAGMVLAAQGRIVKSLATKRLLTQLREWGLGLGTRPASGLVKASQASSDKAQAYAPTPPGDQWGNLSEVYRDEFVRLAVRQADRIPPGKTGWFGGATYFVDVTTTAGQTYTVGLAHLPAYTPPIRRDDLDGAQLVVKESGFVFNSELTDPTPLSLKQALSGLQAIDMRLTEYGRSNLGVSASQRELRLAVGASYFDPEASSGPAKNRETPRLVAFRRLVTGDVSFDEAKATNHVAVGTAGEPCAGVLWIFTTSGIAWLTGASGDQPLLTDSILGEPLLPSGGALSEYRISCGKQQNLLRIQADVSSAADYAVYVYRAKTPDPDGYDSLVKLFADRWRSDATGSQRELMGRVGESIADVTNMTVASEIPRLETVLQSGDRAFFMLETRRERFEQALKGCCNDARTLRIAVELLRAEQGLAYDEKLLRTAMEFSSPGYALKSRVEKILKPPPGNDKPSPENEKSPSTNQ